MDAAGAVQGTPCAGPSGRGLDVSPSLTLRTIAVLFGYLKPAAQDQQASKLHTGERVRAGGR
jgi:hypothetical protein